MTTASLQKLDSLLSSMVGKRYIIKSQLHQVVRYHFDDDKLTLVTDKKSFVVDVQNSLKLLESFSKTDQTHE
ncbi:hypothetical protein GO755_22650 [Spirosoma sp. HMF4905]|uniref:Uncharacterized protein n=1 Tax=Spirosoma arboris TaxID=2682092 RepID=A0A7K1SGB2_9BACT|nr:hypothetical protein [Spirosoma arboris]MVM32857.1 hypothetical protein [Spirosoma arboris]